MKTNILKTASFTALIAGSIYASTLAYAGPKCTNAPEEKWISESVMKEKIAEMGYKKIKMFTN